MARSGKGSQFERDVCRALSVWWTGDPDTHDIFWRTSQSGGRATSRAKAGKRNKHHCGDIAAIDPSGSKLTDLITFELKRGYNRADPVHLLDRPKRSAQQPFEAFLHQAIEASDRAGTRFWTIIHKRDQREPMAYFPTALLPDGKDNYRRILHFVGTYRDADKEPNGVRFSGTTFDWFLNVFDRKFVALKLKEKS